ncbi:hypothetical protein [Pseudomonas sichuanensis]|uniref:hypothetical protein n=1 Tax=Pseudomonas sichuanensis TaxID=2213015 RepID=UPI000DA6B09C|nr:hypothetical protein [Pseudomonas sichuanensis]
MQDHIVDLGTNGAKVDGQLAKMALDIRVQPGGVDAARQLIEFGAENKSELSRLEYGDGAAFVLQVLQMAAAGNLAKNARVGGATDAGTISAGPKVPPILQTLSNPPLSAYYKASRLSLLALVVA